MDTSSFPYDAPLANSLRGGGLPLGFLQVSRSLILPLLNSPLRPGRIGHAGSITSPEPGTNHHPDGSRISEQKKIDRVPCRFDRPQALHPSGRPAMLVWSGPGFSLLYAPEFSGRKSPCRNAEGANECIGPYESEFSGFFCIMNTPTIEM